MDVVTEGIWLAMILKRTQPNAKTNIKINTNSYQHITLYTSLP